MAENLTKLFVLDTNVLLHDVNSLFAFQDNDVLIPITVMEELDSMKKGFDQINFNAREITRSIDRIFKGGSPFTGAPLGAGLGSLYVGNPSKEYVEEMTATFAKDTHDHRILATAKYASDNINKAKYSAVILVSKDVNMRVKAVSVGLVAEDYENDKVKSFDDMNRDVITMYKDREDVSGLYAKGKITELDCHHPNSYFIVKSHDSSSSALVRYDKASSSLVRIERVKVSGIEARNAEQAFSFDALLNTGNQLVALSGKAGTGKTLIALASALAQMKGCGFDRILLARPIVPLSNKDIGFLPGDIDEKVGPYMLPLYDNLSFIKKQMKTEDARVIDQMVKDKIIDIIPLAYIRGRSLSNAFIIIDEAQNMTPHEMKTVVTRAGEGTKMVFTGDIQQIDSPYLDEKSNGLTYLIDKMRGQELFAHVNLVKGERSLLAELASNLL